MKLKFYLFVFISFVLVIDGAKKQENPKCSQKSLDKVDKQLANVCPLMSGGKMPETEKQLMKYCSGVLSSMESTATYIKNCGGTFGPIVAKLMSTYHKKDYNSICKLRNQKLVRQVLSVGKCSNSVTTKLQKCLNQMVDSLTAIKSVPFDDRVNTGCCHAYKIVTCMQKAVSRSKRCDKDLIERAEKVVFAELGDFCGNYFSNDEKCLKLVSKTPKLNDSYVRPKSMFPPMMGLMDSFRQMQCTAQDSQRMDTFFQEMLTIGTPDDIPETGEQLSRWCTKAKRNAPYVYGYIESCVSDFGKMLAKVMAGSAINGRGGGHMELICSASAKNALDNPSPFMREYIKAAKCGNRAENKIKVCFDVFNQNMMSIAQAPEKSRIKMACCNSYQFRNCIFNATSTTKGCSAQTIEWAESQVMAGVESSINMICPDLWGNDKKCDQILSDIPPIDPKTYVRPKSPFFPMMKLLDSFPDVDLDQK